MARVRRHFLIEGRVPGVGFRHSAVGKALSLSLTGWVRNLPNGAVEVQAQGEEDHVLEMEKWLRRGPSMARVTRCTVIERPLEREETAFTIRHF